MKDSWVSRDRAKEGASWLKVIESASTDDEAAALEDALLGVLARGEVFVSGSPDCTLLLQDDGTESIASEEESGQPEDPASEPESLTTVGSDPEVPQSTVKRPSSKLDQLVHYRIVYQEVCQCLSEVTSVTAFFTALSQAVNGASELA